MRNINFAKLKQRLKNGFVAALFVGAQVGAVTVPFLNAAKASAAVVSSSVSSSGFVIKNTSSYSVVGGQPTAVGSFKNGNVGAYPEGACIPAVFQVTNTSGSTGDLFVTPVIDYLKSGTKDLGFTRLETVTSSLTDATTATNLNQLGFTGTELSSATSFQTTTGSTVTATVSGPYSGNDTTTTGVSNSDTFRHYNVTLNNVPNGVTVNVLTCGRLGLDASEYNGSSLSIRTVQGGQENVPIPVNEILVLPSITITKTVSGGSALPTDFSFTVSQSINGQSVFPITSGNSVTINNVNPDGQYTITESGPANYKFTSGTGSSCTVYAGTIGTANGQMTATVAAGKPATNATCNFTNTLQQGSITLVKNVVNNNGGTANANSFGLSIGGTSVTSGQTLQLNPGSYSINEAGLAGYQFVNITGTGCPATLGGSVNLSGGQNITCTITNDDVAPSLTLNKIVSNTHGGGATESAWTLTATGPTTLSGSGAAGSADVVSGSGFAAGTYTLSESGGPSGYSASAWTCTNSVSVTNNQITLANGQSTTCSITNSDIAPILVILKQVLNPYGTPLSPDSFSLTVDGTGVISGAQNTQFNAGTHTVGETQQPGYSFTSFTGSNCTIVNGAMTAIGVIGGTTTCTVTNTAIQPKLIVIKHVVNDSGGTKTAPDFTMTVSGNSQSVPNFAGSEAGTQIGLNEGSYSVDELADAGYAKSLSTDCSGTIAVGQTKTCTITNDDIAPTLGVEKHVINDNGGTKFATDFHLYVNGVTLNDPRAGGGTVEDNSVIHAYEAAAAGVQYTITEDQETGYQQTGSVECIDRDTQLAVPYPVTLSLAQNVRCTITNNDVAPQLTVIKHVVNNNVGSKTAGDFVMNVTGTNVSDSSFAGSESGTTVNLDAGAYSVGEDTVTGYTPSLSADCTGTVHVGDTKTCTITNTAQPGSISGYKCEANATATTCGENGLEGWTIYADLNNNNAFDIGEPSDVTDANGAYTIGGLAPGSYTIREVNQTDWTQIFPGSPNDKLVVILDQGENSTDNNFGNFHGATISGTKWNDANGNHEFDENESTLSDWTIFIDANDNQTLDNEELSTTTDDDGNYSFTNLAPGTYTVCEQMKNGWVQTFPQVNNGCHTVVVDLSGHNYDGNNFGNQGQGTVTIIKDAQPDSDQAFTFTGNLTGDDESNFTLTDDAGDTGHERRVFSNLPQGTYTVTEPNNVKGWELTDITCTGGSDTATHERNAVIKLKPGENVTCTFTNVGKASLTVVKDAQPNDTQDFHYTITQYEQEYSKSFNLDDDSDPTLSNTEVTDGLNTGTYVIHEDETAGWTLADVNCGEGVEFGQEGSYVYVTLEPGSDITCTFTNKKHSTVIVTKYNDLNRNGVQDENEPLLPNWEFNLTNNQCDEGSVIGDFLVQILDNSSNCYNETEVTNQEGNATFEDVHPDGTFELTETIPANSNWNLSNIHCTDNEENVGRTSEGNDYYLFVNPGATVHCYVGNYQDTGTVTVIKKLTPSTDHGKFNLNINGTTYAANVGDGGTTGAIKFVTGGVTASETAGTNTSLDDYEASYNCVDGEGTITSGTGSTVAFNLKADQNVVCTFTNNKGEILGATAPLVNTGNNILATSLVSLGFITAVAGLGIATRRRNPGITYIKK